MKIYVTRDSVAAGDDVHAPHAAHFEVRDASGIETIVEHILAARYLPSISGGQATWSVVSAVPIAVTAQQWDRTRHLAVPGGIRGLDVAGGVLRIHFNYHAQIDPEIVHRILWSFRLRAI